MLNVTPIKFKGSESAGSIAKRNEPTEEKSAYRASFKGAESAGSIANTDSLVGPKTDTVNFKGANASSGAKSSGGFGKALIVLAGIVGGLGLLHKKGVTAKMGNNKVSQMFQTVTEKCYDACHFVKSKITGLFTKKTNP